MKSKGYDRYDEALDGAGKVSKNQQTRSEAKWAYASLKNWYRGNQIRNGGLTTFLWVSDP